MVHFVSSLCAAAIALVGCATQVQAHGYMYIPLAEFDGTATSAWIVQIEPQFDADWESVADDTELIALYVEKAAEYGYTDNIRSLLDSDTTLYGADCGFTNPDADAKDPPTDGTATFSRGVAHHGPCEIWLDDTMVLHNDDCALAFGTSDYETIKSVFTPVDYSSCSTGGCMLRFYWLAFQGVDGEYVWQIYKDCVPLTGPAEGQTSTATEAPATETPATDVPATETPATETPATETPTTEAPATEAPATEAPATETPTTEAPTTEAPTATETESEATVVSTETPTVTSSTSEKCTRKRV